MSATAVLIPIAVAIFATTGGLANQIKEKRYITQSGSIENIETKYVSADLLVKTLEEHGVSVRQNSENEIVAEFEEGVITYVRDNNTEAFRMNVSDIKSAEDVLCNVEMIEKEYQSNVQTYTYERVLNNLPENMSIDNETVLEDDSILITLTVD